MRKVLPWGVNLRAAMQDEKRWDRFPRSGLALLTMIHSFRLCRRCQENIHRGLRSVIWIEGDLWSPCTRWAPELAGRANFHWEVGTPQWLKGFWAPFSPCSVGTSCPVDRVQSWDLSRPGTLSCFVEPTIYPGHRRGWNGIKNQQHSCDRFKTVTFPSCPPPGSGGEELLNMWHGRRKSTVHIKRGEEWLLNTWCKRRESPQN